MSRRDKSMFSRALNSSLVLAMIATAAFYYVIFTPEMRESTLAHYTTEHPVEYVIVALFMWGVIDMIIKLLAFPVEIAATQQQWLPPRTGRVSAGQAGVLLEQVRAGSAWRLKTRVGKRLMQALSFVRDKGSAGEFSEQLKYLADQDHNESQANYTLLRFVIAVTPILGFLGTVVHFGTALGGFSLGNVDEQLKSVVSEMGTAFNTTSIALGATMTMIFALFLCERVERNLLSTTDRLLDCELLNRFEVKDANVTPVLASIQTASQDALDAIGATLNRQVELWSQSLEALFQRFDYRQEQETKRRQDALNEVHRQHEEFSAEREEWLRQALAHVEAHQDGHMRQIQSIFESALSLRDSVAELLETLTTIARGEGRLIQLQSSLSDNLRVLHESQHFDATLHGLTAAIHLLTARKSETALHDNRAAA